MSLNADDQKRLAIIDIAAGYELDDLRYRNDVRWLIALVERLKEELQRETARADENAELAWRYRELSK